MSDAMKWIGLAGATLMLGCSSSGLGNGGGPGPGSDVDLSSWTAPADLAWSPPIADMSVVPQGAIYRYVLNSILLPQGRQDYSIDLNGDGHIDNQLGNIIGALAAQGFSTQMAVDQAIRGGSTLELVALQTSDSQLQNDPAAGAGLVAATPTAAPDFSGAGRFTIDPASRPALFVGGLGGGQFSSESPVTTTNPVHLTLKLPLIGPAPFPIPINGAHLQFTTGTDPTSGAPGLLNGQIQGSIRNSDVQGTIIPAIAQLLTAKIAQNPNSPSSMMILQLFDTGNCTNADGSVAVAGDRRIDPCEVGSNNIIMNVLAPDVQIYDANGNYAPSPANRTRDSLSLGLGFSAVQATF